MLDQRFIKNLSDEIGKRYAKSPVYVYSLFADFWNKAIPIDNDDKVDAIFNCDWADDFIFALNSVRNIISDPKLILRPDRVVVQADTANRVDNIGFQQTMKESKLWRRENDSPRPNYVYNTFFEDEVRISENLFVVAVVNKIAEINSRYLYFLNKNINYFKKIIANNEPTVYNMDFIASIKNTKYRDVKKDKYDLDYSEDAIAISFRKLNRIRILLNHIRSTPFYIACDSYKKYNLGNVIPTKILLDVKDYFNVYNFWNKYSKVNMHMEYFDYNEETYHNFVLSKLVYVLIQSKYQLKDKNCKFLVLNGALTTPPQGITLRRKGLELTIKCHRPTEIEIEVIFFVENIGTIEDEAKRNGRRSNYFIKTLATVENLIELEDHQLNKIIHDIHSEYVSPKYSETFLLTALGAAQTEKTIVKLNSNDINANSIVSGLINMVTMITRGDSYVYTMRCPICGSSIIERNIETGNLTCLECNGMWSILYLDDDSRDSNVIYIKRF